MQIVGFLFKATGALIAVAIVSLLMLGVQPPKAEHSVALVLLVLGVQPPKAEHSAALALEG